MRWWQHGEHTATGVTAAPAVGDPQKEYCAKNTACCKTCSESQSKNRPASEVQSTGAAMQWGCNGLECCNLQLPRSQLAVKWDCGFKFSLLLSIWLIIQKFCGRIRYFSSPRSHNELSNNEVFPLKNVFKNQSEEILHYFLPVSSRRLPHVEERAPGGCQPGRSGVCLTPTEKRTGGDVGAGGQPHLLHHQEVFPSFVNQI